MTANANVNSRPGQTTEQFIQQVVQDTIGMMANQLLLQTINSYPVITAKASEDSGQDLSQGFVPVNIFEILFKKATGRMLIDVIQETRENIGYAEKQNDLNRHHHAVNNLRFDFEKMIRNATMQELSNTAKNMEISLRQASGTSNDQILLRMEGNYFNDTSFSLRVVKLVNSLLPKEHRTTNNMNDIRTNDNHHGNHNNDHDDSRNTAQNIHFGFYRHKIQTYLRSALDGAMHSALRHASRTIVTHSLERIGYNAHSHLESFTLHRKKEQKNETVRSRIKTQAFV